MHRFRFYFWVQKQINSLKLRPEILKEIDTIYQILDDHFYCRLHLYKRRKQYLLEKLQRDILLRETKMRFMNDVMDEEIIVYKQAKQNIISSLQEREYPFYENNILFWVDDRK